jgi:hypothetical protein
VRATYHSFVIAPSDAGVSATDVVNELVTDVSAVDNRVTAMETHATKQHDAGLDQETKQTDTVECLVDTSAN